MQKLFGKVGFTWTTKWFVKMLLPEGCQKGPKVEFRVFIEVLVWL